MRDITLSILNRLLADTQITAVVSTRIYRAGLPKKPTLPAIVVSKVDDIRPNDTTGVNYAVSRIQTTVFANSDGQADQISGLIADSLNALVNTLSGVTIISVFDAGVRTDNNPDAAIWMYHRDFMVTYL
jgi:hypothetical protein